MKLRLLLRITNLVKFGRMYEFEYVKITSYYNYLANRKTYGDMYLDIKMRFRFW